MMPYVIGGSIGETKVVQNNCDYPTMWRIKISPDKESGLNVKYYTNIDFHGSEYRVILAPYS